MEQPGRYYDDFVTSAFYGKYKGTYHVDAILKRFFGYNIRRISRIAMSEKSYGEVHGINVRVFSDFMKLYCEGNKKINASVIYAMIKSFYLDPDAFAIRYYPKSNVKCTADGLISVKRIIECKGFNDSFIVEYAKYRNRPIIYFPQEKNGINMSRNTYFGDKIDHTLFDLKQYFASNEAREKCKLIDAYRLPRTAEWLRDVGSFENLIDWYGVKNIFTNEQYEVYDLESGGSEIITAYADSYSWYWSNQYYENLKGKIDIISDM